MVKTNSTLDNTGRSPNLNVTITLNGRTLATFSGEPYSKVYAADSDLSVEVTVNINATKNDFWCFATSYNPNGEKFTKSYAWGKTAEFTVGTIFKKHKISVRVTT